MIVGIDHIYLTASDFARSEMFYDGVMRALGFKKGDKRIGGEPHAHYFNPYLQISIRPARTHQPHDPYAAGLHHLCLQVADRQAVDEAEAALRGLGVEPTAASEYPQYNDDYYATFFVDPDGMRIEIVARSRHRQLIADRWDELESFLNPVAEMIARQQTD